MYTIGDTVIYRGDASSLWLVLSIEDGIKHRWTRAQKIGTGISKTFPYEVFELESKFTPKVTITIKDKPKKEHKPKPNLDDIGALMAEARSVDECWVIAKLAGLDVDEVKSKIGHLSNGLQKMGISNRLRKLVKDGKLEPTIITWDSDHGFTLNKGD